jgi:hypothetical protein
VVVVVLGDEVEPELAEVDVAAAEVVVLVLDVVVPPIGPTLWLQVVVVVVV